MKFKSVFGEVTSDYLTERNSETEVIARTNGNLQDLYLIVDGGDGYERLFTVTNIDGRANDVGVLIRTKQLKFAIEAGLKQARLERSPDYLKRQIALGIGVFAFIWLSNFPLRRGVRSLRKLARHLAPTANLKTLSVTEQLAHRQKWNLAEIQYRLMQLLQVLLWCGGIMGILNLYPQTRIIPFLLIAALRIPFRIALVALVVYFLIRLTYLLIAKLSAAANRYPIRRCQNQSARQVENKHNHQNYAKCRNCHLDGDRNFSGFLG